MACRYCECFASRTFCQDCNCVGCSNTPENEEAVRKAVAATLERNPSAFRAKINISPQTTGGGVLALSTLVAFSRRL
jgi:hypothetical protein